MLYSLRYTDSINEESLTLSKRDFFALLIPFEGSFSVPFFKKEQSDTDEKRTPEGVLFTSSALQSNIPFLLLSVPFFDLLCPVTANACDQLQKLGAHRLGEGGHHAEGLESEGAGIADLGKSLHEALPVADVLVGT